MLLEKYPEAEKFVVDMEKLRQEENVQQDESAWNQKLGHILQSRADQQIFVVFENMNTELSEAERQHLTTFLQKCPEAVRVIFVSRKRPDECLLPFLWKRQMEIIPQQAFILSRSEIQKMIMEMGCEISAKDVYEQTEGWAGCVDMMLRLAKRQQKYDDEMPLAKELRESYEIEQFIQYTILDALTEAEKSFLKKAVYCPLINEKMCEDIF